MTDTPARGLASAIAVDTVTPIDGSSTRQHFISSSIGRTDTHVRSEGPTGTRSQIDSRVRLASTRVGGQLVLEPSATEIDWWIQRILGGTTAVGVTAVADTLPEFALGVDKVTKVASYSACRVGRAVISGNQGQPLRWALDIEAESESIANAGTFPSLSLPTDNMFIFSDCTLTLEGTARKFRQFSLTIDNALMADRYNNSTTRSEIPAMDRVVTLSVSAPYTSDNEDLYAAAIAGAAGILVVTDGTDTYTFDFGNCKIPTEPVTVDSKTQEIEIPLTVNCYEETSSGDGQIVCTKT